MSGAALLHIQTPFVLLEIHGHYRSRWGILGSEPKARLSVRSTREPVKVFWADSNGRTHSGFSDNEGPCFFEDTAYRIWTKSFSQNLVPTIVHRDPYLFQEVDTYADDLICAGPFNFRGQVGFSQFEIRVGNESLRVTIEVFPVKLDYNEDYTALLSEVAAAGRGLALEYLRATHRFGSTQDTATTTGIEWLSLLRNEIDLLKNSVNYINNHPHRSLSRDITATPVEKIKRAHPLILRAVLRQRGYGPLINVPNVGRVRRFIPAVLTRETLDTPENRWILLNLKLIEDRLGDLHSSVVAEIAAYEHRTRPPPLRVQVEERELAKFVAEVKHLTSLPVFQGIQQPPPAGFVSLCLLSGIGYSDAYHAIMTLRLGLDVHGGPYGISVMDVHDLYETWCFIELVKMITTLTGNVGEVGKLLSVEESGIRVRLQRGREGAVKYFSPSGDRKVMLAYNPQFKGLTGDQRPDIVLTVQHNGWPDLIVVFDAKYRVEASEEYKSRFGIPGPPQDAINVLHRYRDAIVLDNDQSELQRPVVKGVALYPLSLASSHAFESSRLYEALNVLGIGALPFLVGNTGYVKSWLEQLLLLTPEALAEPGPPFSGLQEKQRRLLMNT